MFHLRRAPNLASLPHPNFNMSPKYSRTSSFIPKTPPPPRGSRSPQQQFQLSSPPSSSSQVVASPSPECGNQSSPVDIARDSDEYIMLHLSTSRTACSSSYVRPVHFGLGPSPFDSPVPQTRISSGQARSDTQGHSTAAFQLPLPTHKPYPLVCDTPTRGSPTRRPRKRMGKPSSTMLKQEGTGAWINPLPPDTVGGEVTVPTPLSRDRGQEKRPLLLHRGKGVMGRFIAAGLRGLASACTLHSSTASSNTGILFEPATSSLLSNEASFQLNPSAPTVERGEDACNSDGDSNNGDYCDAVDGDDSDEYDVWSLRSGEPASVANNSDNEGDGDKSRPSPSSSDSILQCRANSSTDVSIDERKLWRPRVHPLYAARYGSDPNWDFSFPSSDLATAGNSWRPKVHPLYEAQHRDDPAWDFSDRVRRKA